MLYLYEKLLIMHTLELQKEKQKLIKNQNKTLILIIWCAKLYFIAFGILCAATIKSSNNNIAQISQK